MQERDCGLEELDVANNGISEAGAEALARLLAGKALKRLNVNMNALGNGGMYKLADALKERDTLEELDLGGNNVGPEGARVLMAALQGKQALQTLELGCAAAAHASRACISLCAGRGQLCCRRNGARPRLTGAGFAGRCRACLAAAARGALTGCAAAVGTTRWRRRA